MYFITSGRAIHLHISDAALANGGVGETRVIHSDSMLVLVSIMVGIGWRFDFLKVHSVDRVMNNG